MQKETFQALFSEYQEPLFTYLYRMCYSKETAEELVQETFYRAMVSLRPKDMRYARAWLHKVARNLYIDWLRRRVAEQKMIHSVEQSTPAISSWGIPEEYLKKHEDQQKIIWVMQQLPERMKTILYLREIEEFSYQELAEAMDMEMAQVKVTLHRAREKFRQWAERWERGEQHGSRR